MIDFLICYEHINREVENDALIKYELEKRGYSCDIISFNGPGFYKYSRKRNKAGVVVSPWLRCDENVYHYLQLCDKKNKIVNLQWEQIYNSANIKSGACNTTGESLKASHICWGEYSKNRLKESGCDPDLLPVTGAIQTDYGRPVFDEYYLSKEELSKNHGLNINKRWILMISSFAYATYGESAIKGFVERFGESINEQAKLHRESLEVTLDWIEKFLLETDTEFIYRPHPSEKNYGRISDLQKKYPNFHVIRDHSVKQWAKVCDNVNVWLSTSNIEILSLGVNYSVIRPIDIPKDIELISYYNEDFIDDYESFKEANLKQNTLETIDEKIKNLSYYYSFDKNEPAYKKVADYLIDMLRSGKSYNFEFNKEDKKAFKRKVIRMKAVSFLEFKCLKSGSTRILKFLPIKRLLKENIKKMVDNHISANEMAEKMISYLNDQQNKIS